MKKFVLLSFISSISFLVLNTNLFAQSGWSEDVRLTYRQGYSYDPRAACCGDTIHLVWWEHYTDSQIHEEVFYKHSTDAGLTWGPDVMLSVEDEQSSIVPIVARDGAKVYAFWGEDGFGTLFRKSTDSGTTWGSIDSTLQGEFYRDVFIVDDTIFLAGARNPGDIIFRKSTDAGMSWLPLRVVGYGAYVRHAVSPPVIGFVYQVARYSQEIMFKRSTDNGNTWPDSLIISHYDSISGQWAVIDVDTFSNMHVAWYDYKYSPYSWTGDIFYRASRDSGNTWEEIDSLTVEHRAVHSDILAGDSDLHLVWEDDRHDFGNNFEIYYRMSTDLGQTWRNEVRLTDTLNWSRRPSLVCDGQYLHLFWFDLRDDPSNIVGEIYYKRKNLTGIDETKNYRFVSTGLSLSCATILRGSSLIHYDLGSYKNGEIMILDVTGRVLNKFQVHQISGYFVFGSNKEVCDGIYFIMLKVEKEHITKKVLVVR